jgi:glycosyltransferase involved in cell wall biosynthesis
VAYFVDGYQRAAYGVSAYLRTLLGALDRRVVSPVGVFIGPGKAVDTLGALMDDVTVLADECLLPLTRPGRGRMDPPNLLRKSALMARATLALPGAMRRLGTDVMDVNFYPLHLIAGAGSLLASRPCVAHWHGPFAQTGVSAFVATTALRFTADSIPCISRFVMESLPPAARARACVVHNGVDTKAIAASQQTGELRRRLGIGPEVPLVGIFGAVTPRKGHEYLIRAAAEVAKVHGDLVVGIFGDETPQLALKMGLTRRLQSLAEDLGLSRTVRFAGFVPDCSRFMSDCDVVCMPTVPIGKDSGEGFGLSMAEAMAAGTAVIATNCGAPPEVIEDGTSGLLVPPRDPGALAAAILKLLDDPRLRRRMGAAAQRRVRESFDVATMARKLERIYVELASPRRS